MSGGAKLKPTRRTRAATLVVVALLHVLAGIAIVQAFAPDLTAAVADRARSVLTVTISSPEPTPNPPPNAEALPDEGAAAEAGRRARPKEVAAPKQRIPVDRPPAARASSAGKEFDSGATDSGEGTGAAGTGTGTGSGNAGGGMGAGVRKLEKIAGDINSARDYPRETRDRRVGHSVTILLTVGTDGRVTGCRVTDPSPDPTADAITCRLAKERFRFRPAADASGKPIIGRYAWRQRWYY